MLVQPALFLSLTMLSQIAILVKINLQAIFRDRVLYAVLGVGLVIILAVPPLSSFSMRQVQELAITLSLSAISSVLLVVALLLGASSIWRDVERRYTSSVLTLPVSRANFVLSKFFSFVLFLLICSLFLGLCSVLVISLSASSYPSDVPIHWLSIFLAVVGTFLKYTILCAFAVLLSAVSTSFYLPFFVSIIVLLCGNASQEVFEFLSKQTDQLVSPLFMKIITIIYYVLPNFSSLDFQTYAVYGLDIPLSGLIFVPIYSIIYTSILLLLAVFAFEKRELS